MSIRSEYVDYLKHFGKTLTVRELHGDVERPDAIALRHDVDHDLHVALEMALVEHEHGVRSTYFLLHTHPYWQDRHFLEKCRQLVDYGHEVGLHMNALTEWMGGSADDVESSIRSALARLREGGLEIVGTSAHGDRACYQHGFINYWMWKELRGDEPQRQEHGRSAEGVVTETVERQVPYPPDHALVRDDGQELALWASSLDDHGLAYDAVHVPHDVYWSDSGGRWLGGHEPLQSDMSRGRHQVLMHPCWWKAPSRSIFVLSLDPRSAEWFADVVDRATSCHGQCESTMHRIDEQRDDDADGPGATPKRVPITAHRRIATEVRRSLVRRQPTHGDVLETSTRLLPFLPDLMHGRGETTLVLLHEAGEHVVGSMRGTCGASATHEGGMLDEGQACQDDQQCIEDCWTYRRMMEFLMASVSHRIDLDTIRSDREQLVRELGALGITVHADLAMKAFRPLEHPAATAGEFASDVSDACRSKFDTICGPVQHALGGVDESLSGATRHPGADLMAGSHDDIDIDFTGKTEVPISGWRVRRRCDTTGLHVFAERTAAANAHLLIGRGWWHLVRRGGGLPVLPDSFYVCQIDATVAVPQAVRLFALSFDAKGHRLCIDQVMWLDGEGGIELGTFVPANGATHIALALHLGKQPPKSELTLRRIRLRPIPFIMESSARGRTLTVVGRA